MRWSLAQERRAESNAASVVRQLCDALEVSVRLCREPHRYGSTLAIETLCEIDLNRTRVIVPVETEWIPVDVTTTCLRNDVAFRVRFFNPRIRAGMATYEAELI